MKILLNIIGQFSTLLQKLHVATVYENLSKRLLTAILINQSLYAVFTANKWLIFDLYRYIEDCPI